MKPTLWRRALRALRLLDRPPERVQRHRWVPPCIEALEDRFLLATFTVLNTNDSGPDSFRQAIIASNATQGQFDTIEFKINSSGAQRILLLSDLPTITDPVFIDGTTQQDFNPNQTPIVEIRGPDPSVSLAGGVLTITAGGSTVRGLVINSSPSSGIQILNGNGNLIAGNYIGTDVLGTSFLDNAAHGIEILNSNNNTIGGTALADRNLISGNDASGIALGGASLSSNGNVILGNFIGTDVTGESALENGDGISIQFSSNNTIGGTAPGARNLISGNDVSGIFLSFSTQNLILGNFIGTNSTGTTNVDNFDTGITLELSSNNTIGGAAAGAGNLISGNDQAGISLDQSSNLNSILGNFIGTDVTGTVSLANRVGIHVDSPGNIIGGLTAGAGNLISGNTEDGIALDSEFASNTLIRGNFIGSDVSGSFAVPNGEGIFVSSTANTIGGTAAAAGNLISGNIESGIRINNQNNSIQGNRIGTAADGITSLGNGADGIRLEENDATSEQADNNTIGGTVPGSGNTIAFNGIAGVNIRQGVNNSILGNSIFGNARQGIDLGDDKITPNDSGDGDTGENNLQNFPDLTAAFNSSAGFTVQGTLNSADATTYRVEFFATDGSSGGTGEGQTFLGFADVTTDSSGNAIFTFVASSTTVSPDMVISATATDPANNTSEFSAPIGIANQPPVLASIGPKNVNEGVELMFTVSATDVDSPPQVLTFTLTGAPIGSTFDPLTNTFRWTPTEAQGPGSVPLTVRVTDNGNPNFFDEEAFTITVNEVNQPPVLDDIPDVTIDEEKLFQLKITAKDPDLPANKLTFSLINPPAGAAIDANSGVFQWTPTEAQGLNSFPITVRVVDQFRAESVKNFKIMVQEVNQPPILDFIGDQFIDEGVELTIQPTATDLDVPSNNLTFSVSNAPPGSTFDPMTAIFKWTPTEDQGPGTFALTVRVTDDGNPNLFDEETIKIGVGEVNQPPILNQIDDRVVDEQTLLTFTATVTDPDVPPNALVFSLSNAPAGATIDPSTGVFMWIPDETQGPGVYFVTISVTDNGGGGSVEDPSSISGSFDETQVKITVNEVNRPPVLAPIANQIVNQGSLVTFTATATDPDIPANSLTFSLINAPAGAVIDPITGVFTWTPSAGQGPGAFNFQVRVTDDGQPNLFDTRDVVITVRIPPRIPTPDDSGMLIALVGIPKVKLDTIPFFQAIGLLGGIPVTPTITVRGIETAFSSLVGMSASVSQEVLGEISGHVFMDLNGNGKQDDGEPGLRGQRVFLDQNDNGIPDESEPSVESDGNGRYHFPGLQLTRYRVRQDLRNRRIVQTEPEKNAPHEIELTVDINSVPNVDFGAKLLPATAVAPSEYTTPAPSSPVRIVPAAQEPDPKNGVQPAGPGGNGGPQKGAAPKPDDPPE